MVERDDLCCGICLEEYNNSEKEPRMLNCGHTFCTICLLKLFKQDKFFCPEDQLPIKALSVSSLAKNYALKRLLESSPPRKQLEICEVHRKELEYVCREDNVKICANCAIFGSHKGHNICSLEEIASEMAKQPLKDLLSSVEDSYIAAHKRITDINELYESFKLRKTQLDSLLKNTCKSLHEQLDDIEKSASLALHKHFNYIESQFMDKTPKSIEAYTAKWKENAKTRLYELNYSDSPDSELIEEGTRLLEELEKTKEIELGNLERFLESVDVKITPDPLRDLVVVSPKPKFLDRKESKSTFSEDVFNQGLAVLKFHTNDVADFTGAGDVGDRAIEIAEYLANNQYLKSLKLVRNKISDTAALAIFKALEQNNTLQTLHLSQNPLEVSTLDALIDMLEVNTSLKDIYLIGNRKMTLEYKNKFSGMSSRLRRIITK